VSQKELNLGILAHVDAGKTTLTERLLYEAGAIDELGSVDAGTTQTDSLALEQQRGITIRSAVASFALGDVHVNLIDTPGHPDFIAEVERVLSVLDGAVLVISAVEGVQPQTRVLMRALKRLRVPTLLFLNKIDRAGADGERVLEAVSERLTPAVVPMGSAKALGTRAAGSVPFAADDSGFHSRLSEILAERDDGILAAYVGDEPEVPYERLRDALATQTSQSLVHPVYFGSALTGAGVEPLMSAIRELLPASDGDPEGPLAATVFKIERGPSGEKIAYVRMFSGTVRVRDVLRFGGEVEGKVTALAKFEEGLAVQAPSVSAGQIGKLWGLREIQIGDPIGEAGAGTTTHEFAPPTLESVVEAADPGERASLRVALAQLAEQDPLINVRQDAETHEVSVSLYGEVQKEVIQATLADEYGIDALFREVTPIYIERPLEAGEVVEILHAETNPFNATIGFRIEPAPAGSGVDFRVDVDTRTVPLYVFKTLDSFSEHMEEYVRETLREGLSGWQVADCVVAMNRCGYSVPDGPPSRRGPLSTAADFRKLAPLVLMQALQQAGTVVCEPVMRASVEIPTETIGAVVPAPARLGAMVETSSVRGELTVVETLVPAARVNDVQRHLPGLTRGEGVLESTFAGYEPVAGEQPTRRRTTPSPLNLDEYVMHLARRQ
jgi:ribosomal protection tetracycline resistance protein